MRRHPVHRVILAAFAVGTAVLAMGAGAAAGSPASAGTPTPSLAPVTIRVDAPEAVHLYSLFGSEDLAAPILGAAEPSVTLALPEGLDTTLGLPAELSYRVSTRGVQDAGTATRQGALVEVPVATTIREAALDGGLVTVEVSNGVVSDEVPAEPGAYLRVQEVFEFRSTAPQPSAEPVLIAERADVYDVFTFPDSATPTSVAWGQEVAIVLPADTTWTAGPGSWSGLVPSATLYWASSTPGEDEMRQEFLPEQDVRISPDGSTATVVLPRAAPEGWTAAGAPWLSVAAGDQETPGHSVQANVTLAVSDATSDSADPAGAFGSLPVVALGGVLVVAGVVVVVLRRARRRSGSTARQRRTR